MLHLDLYTDLLTNFFQFFGKYLKFFRSGICIHDHHHIKIILHDGLGNIQDIYIILCQIGTYFCNNSYGVFSNYSDNCFFHLSFLLYSYNARSNKCPA